MIFEQNDWRSNLDPDWTRWVYSMIKKLELTTAERENFSIQALRYILSKPLVSAMALGVNSESQLDKYLCLDTIPPDDQLMQKINSIIPRFYPPFG